MDITLSSTSSSTLNIPTPPVPTILPSTIPWTLSDEEALTKREKAIAHLVYCIEQRDRCELELINFRNQYPNESVINADPILYARLLELITAKNEAWYAYFKAYDAVHPKTVEDVLWVVAKAGFVEEVAPLMNISKVTRNCIHLQPIMMNVKLGKHRRAQLHHCTRKGLISSVKRLLSIRNINVHVKDDSGWTSLHFAARKNHIDIAKLLILNGAVVNAKSKNGWTPLHLAACNGHIDILHLLVKNGADLEAQNNGGGRVLHWAADKGHLSFIQELVSRYHVDINARTSSGNTALGLSSQRNYSLVIAYLQANGGSE
jgi:hypothetical protein